MHLILSNKSNGQFFRLFLPLVHMFDELWNLHQSLWLSFILFSRSLFETLVHTSSNTNSPIVFRSPTTTHFHTCRQNRLLHHIQRQWRQVYKSSGWWRGCPRHSDIFNDFFRLNSRDSLVDLTDRTVIILVCHRQIFIEQPDR